MIPPARALLLMTTFLTAGCSAGRSQLTSDAEAVAIAFPVSAGGCAGSQETVELERGEHKASWTECPDAAADLASAWGTALERSGFSVLKTLGGAQPGEEFQLCFADRSRQLYGELYSSLSGEDRTARRYDFRLQRHGPDGPATWMVTASTTWFRPCVDLPRDGRCLASSGARCPTPRALPACPAGLDPVPLRELVVPTDWRSTHSVAVRGVLRKSPGACTLVGCPEGCCNRCSGGMVLVDEVDPTIEIQGAIGNCTGDESLVCCDLPSDTAAVVRGAWWVPGKDYPFFPHLQKLDLVCDPTRPARALTAVNPRNIRGADTTTRHPSPRSA